MSFGKSKNAQGRGPQKVPRGRAYDIGYGRPPRAHRFKPGQSGNPRGRPKGVKNEATILHHLLNRKIEVREAGRTRRITVYEAILLRFTEEALRGSVKTGVFLFDRYAAQIAASPQLIESIDSDRPVRYPTVAEIRAELKRRGLPPLQDVLASVDENDKTQA